MAVLKKKIVLGGINKFGNSCSNIGLKNIQLVIRHLASRKGCECRFLFPFMSTTSTYIHEDNDDKN